MPTYRHNQFDGRSGQVFVGTVAPPTGMRANPGIHIWILSLAPMRFPSLWVILTGSLMPANRAISLTYLLNLTWLTFGIRIPLFTSSSIPLKAPRSIKGMIFLFILSLRKAFSWKSSIARKSCWSRPSAPFPS